MSAAAGGTWQGPHGGGIKEELNFSGTLSRKILHPQLCHACTLRVKTIQSADSKS